MLLAAATGCCPPLASLALASPITGPGGLLPRRAPCRPDDEEVRRHRRLGQFLRRRFLPSAVAAAVVAVVLAIVDHFMRRRAIWRQALQRKCLWTWCSCSAVAILSMRKSAIRRQSLSLQRSCLQTWCRRSAFAVVSTLGRRFRPVFRLRDRFLDDVGQHTPLFQPRSGDYDPKAIQSSQATVTSRFRFRRREDPSNRGGLSQDCCKATVILVSVG